MANNQEGSKGDCLIACRLVDPANRNQDPLMASPMIVVVVEYDYFICRCMFLQMMLSFH